MSAYVAWSETVAIQREAHDATFAVTRRAHSNVWSVDTIQEMSALVDTLQVRPGEILAAVNDKVYAT